MRVTDIETIPVEVPVKPTDEAFGLAPYVSGSRLFDMDERLTFEEALEANDAATTSSKKLLIKLSTDEGITGWGEMKPPTMEVGRTMIDELVAPEVVGSPAWEVETLHERFSRFASSYYVDVTAFLGGVEMAMWDAVGKEAGKPVHQLVGGKTRDSVPMAFCLGLMSPEESREHARFALEQGFSTLKTKASRYWKTDVERIIAMDDETDGELEFRLDPNQGWSYDEAVRVGAKLEDAGVYVQYLEQPIRVDSFGTLEQLRGRLRQPIAVNEDAYFQHNIYLANISNSIDAAVLDVVPAGGVLGLKRLAGSAAEAGISLAHHSNFDLGIKIAAKLHVMSSTPAFNLPFDCVYYSYEDHVLETPLEIDGGRMVVPDRPGLAGAVDESKVEEYRLDE